MTEGKKHKKIKKGKVNHKLSSDDQSTKSEIKLTRYQRWKRRARKMIDDRLKTETKREIWLKLFIAPIICVIGSIFLFLILDYGTFSQLGGLMIAYFIPPLGKESVIPIGVFGGELTIPIINEHIVVQEIDPLLMAFSIAFVDIVTGIFLLWNYDFAKLIPLLGPWMERTEKKGEKKFRESSWLERLAFLGLVLFVMFPFQGSGGVGTTIIGRVIGMNKFKVLISIVIGAIVGCLLIAYFAHLFIGFFKNNLYQGLALLIAIAIIIAIYNFFKYRKKSITNK